jgi:hypothetical protein
MPFSNIIATSTNVVIHLIGSLFASWEKVHQLLPFLDVLAHLIFIKTPPTFYIDFSMSMPFGVYDPTIHKTQKLICFVCCINFKFRRKPFLVDEVFNGSSVNNTFKNKRNSKMSPLKSRTY